MHSINQKAERLRELLDRPEGIELPGCFDVFSAMILERAGFDAVFMSGYGIAASFLEEWIGQGAEVEAIFSGRVVTSRERSIKARCSRVLDALARIGSSIRGESYVCDLRKSMELPRGVEGAGRLNQRPPRRLTRRRERQMD